MGELCGVSSASIGSYEKGATVPKQRVLAKIAAALDVPADRLTGGPETPPAAAPAPSSGAALYDGVLAALKELYGAVEGRMILGGNGTSKKYYMIQGAQSSFVLYEQDIAAIARSAKASMTPLVERMNSARRGT